MKENKLYSMEDIDKILNVVLNKCLISDKIKQPDSNNISEFVSNFIINDIDEIVKNEKISIFLIEKAWIDPMENHNAHGYEPYSYRINEDEAKEFCESKGYYMKDDCWSIIDKLAKYRYKEIKYII